ncbi:hypothetical protein BJX66DRAFT_339919 [Aspergillus keveii]|uniref:Uncharacterized protein n=1 Tax=Aspergillus keveii TaxID=714993 RepID=A0ABR4FZQ9_9EURO
MADVLPRNLKSAVLTDETLTWRQGVYDYFLEPWEHNLEALVKLLGKYVLNRERCAPQLHSVKLDFTAAYGSDGSVPEALERKPRRFTEASQVTLKILYVQAYPLEHYTRLYPIALTIYNRQTPEVNPMIWCGGPMTRVPLYLCPRGWSKEVYAYRFPMKR